MIIKKNSFYGFALAAVTLSGSLLAGCGGGGGGIGSSGPSVNGRYAVAVNSALGLKAPSSTRTPTIVAGGNYNLVINNSDATLTDGGVTYTGKVNLDTLRLELRPTTTVAGNPIFILQFTKQKSPVNIEYYEITGTFTQNGTVYELGVFNYYAGFYEVGTNYSYTYKEAGFPDEKESGTDTDYVQVTDDGFVVVGSIDGEAVVGQIYPDGSTKTASQTIDENEDGFTAKGSIGFTKLNITTARVISGDYKIDYSGKYPDSVTYSYYETGNFSGTLYSDFVRAAKSAPTNHFGKSKSRRK